MTDESNFCRRCGAPLALDVPELEVLRLTRNARSSYHNIFVGIIALLLAMLIVLPWFIVNGAKDCHTDVIGWDSAGELWIIFITQRRVAIAQDT